MHFITKHFVKQTTRGTRNMLFHLDYTPIVALNARIIIATNFIISKNSFYRLYGRYFNWKLGGTNWLTLTNLTKKSSTCPSGCRYMTNTWGGIWQPHGCHMQPWVLTHAHHISLTTRTLNFSDQETAKIYACDEQNSRTVSVMKWQ